MSLRDKLRAKTVGGKKIFKKEIVEWDGDSYEIRQPTVAVRSKIMDKAGIDIGSVASGADKEGDSWSMMQCWLCIECVYEPENSQRIFDDADLENLMDQPSGGFVDRFSGVAMRLMNMAAESGKPSEPISEDKKN